MTELKNQNSENNTKYFGIGVGLLAATVCVFTLILYLGYLLKYAFIIPFISILVITSFIVMVVTAKRRADSLSNTYIADGYFNLALHVILLLVIGGIWQLIWIYRTTRCIFRAFFCFSCHTGSRRKINIKLYSISQSKLQQSTITNGL